MNPRELAALQRITIRLEYAQEKFQQPELECRKLEVAEELAVLRKLVNAYTKGWKI